MRSMRASLLSPLLPSLLSSLLLACQAQAAPPDLADAAAFDSTCASVMARAPATVQERQAYVICNDVALVQQGWTSLRQHAARYREEEEERPSVEAVVGTVRTLLAALRDGLRRSRAMLETIELRAPGDGLLIAPATWVRDLDGDGTVGIAERYFFAIPARGDGPLATGMPAEDEEYYGREYNLKATVRLDQTDIYWALAYHDFAEALVETVLAYDYRRDENPLRQIRLVDADGMRRAQALFAEGLRTSERMRVAALGETDDDQEWLPNPRQADTVFPVPLDATDFRIWEGMLAHLLPLVEGKTLLPLQGNAARDLHTTGLACPAGQGLDIAAFWREPPEYPMVFVQQGGMGNYCRRIDAQRPASGLDAFAESFSGKMDDDGRMMRLLRRWLWVN